MTTLQNSYEVGKIPLLEEGWDMKGSCKEFKKVERE